MAGLCRMSKEEWDDLEPKLAEAERAAHAHYMESEEVRALLGRTDKTPGYLLLQRLREMDDEKGIELFRAVEMYYHELTRADIAVAFQHGKGIGASGGCKKQA